MIQFKIEDWPESLDEEVGMIRLEPREIEAHSGLSFSPSCDSLDDFNGSVARLESGLLFGLIRYVGNPVPGTIIVMEGCVSPHSDEMIESVLMALGARWEDIVWLKVDTCEIGDRW